MNEVKKQNLTTFNLKQQNHKVDWKIPFDFSFITE